VHKVLFIGCGGFLGSVLRYGLSITVQQASNSLHFPYGTLTVNLLGCLLIGFFSCLAEVYGFFNEELRALVFIGFLGGFTTFSTFGNEAFTLLRLGESGWAVLHLGLHIVGGLGAIWLGRMLAQIF
jgi:fluoride exporter